MISVQNGLFLLNGKNYSYAMGVNAVGYLQHLYFGRKLQPADAEFLRYRGDQFSPRPDDPNGDMATDGMPAELGSFGRGDFRSPTVRIARADGGAMSGFRYLSHSVAEGVSPLPGMPCIRRADRTLKVTLKDEFSDTEVDLFYSVSDDSDVLTRSLSVRNVGKESFLIEKAFSFCTELPRGVNYSALRLAGGWACERSPVVTPLAAGTLRVGSARGYSSHQLNPFLALLAEGCGETCGDAYGFNLIYSGSFAMTAEVSPDGGVRVQGGIDDSRFCWKLDGGETFVAPQVALCYSAEGTGGMSRAYADFFRDYIVDPAYAYRKRPVVVNNWEATYFDFDEEKLFAIIDEGAALGVDTFVLDDGWFGKRDDDASGLGDWVVNEKKLKGGLKAIADRCRADGLRFGLWFEPEMVSEDSDLYRAHPDWAIGKAGVRPCRGRNQLVLDLTRREVVDHLFGAVSAILKEYDVSYVKWDKNRDITENFSSSLPADRQGEFSHRYTLGFYDLAERLTKAFPEVFFEGCASGGGRFDGGALYYFPQIWTSDDTDAFERTKIQWGTSLCYPVSAMSCHVSVCPNHQTGRTTTLAARGAVASLGAFGYELDLTRLTEEEKAEISAQIAGYRETEDLVLKGDLYRLSDPFGEDYFCEMLVSKDKTRAYVAGMRLRGAPVGRNRTLRLTGLAEDKIYRIEETGVRASGRALSRAGVFFPRLSEYDGWVWNIREETDEKV